MSTQTLVLRHGKLELPVCFAVADAMPRDAFLSNGESERLEGFQFAAKREGFLLGRLAAKRALGALLEEPDLRRIEIHPGIYGQPLVRHPCAGSLEVTVSHSHGLAVALAFPAEYPMGIDLETLSAISAPVILGELQASPPELAWLATGGVDEATACGILWTAREALGKALKIGLNSPLGILALADIQAAGEQAWAGRYLRFPQCRFLSQATGGRVLTLAMPRDAELTGLPRLDPN
jgi:4'-phosphopantetheinyl transferase